jgi:hypothetical protein
MVQFILVVDSDPISGAEVYYDYFLSFIFSYFEY